MNKAIKLSKSEENVLFKFPLERAVSVLNHSRAGVITLLEKKGLVRRSLYSRSTWFLTEDGRRFLESCKQERESGTNSISI